MKTLVLIVAIVLMTGCATATLSDFIVGKRIHFSPPNEKRTRWIQLNDDGTLQDGRMKEGKYELDGLTLIMVGGERGKATATFGRARVAKGDKFTATEGGKDFVFIVRRVEEAGEAPSRPPQDSNSTLPLKTKD